MLTRPLTRPLTSPLARGITDAGVGFSPVVLFANGEQGVWYDPSDLSTLFQDAAGTTPVTAVEQPVGRVNDKSGRGNHASQSTAAARPVLSARKNLLTGTPTFDPAWWVDSVSGTGGTPTRTANYGIAPDGTQTATRLQMSLNGGATTSDYSGVAATVSGMTVNATYTDTVWMRTTDGSTKQIRYDASGLIGTGDGTYVVDGTWRQYAFSFVADVANRASTIRLRGGQGTSDSADILVWAPQRELGSTATRYQRVTTATDYDLVGFPQGNKYDGVDDYDTSAMGGGGAAGFFYCATLKPGTVDVAQTLWSDRGTNTGYRMHLTTANQLELSAGNGTTYTSVVTAGTVALGVPVVLTAWDDGTNLNVQLNQGAVASVARPVVVAGTAEFTEGRDNGAATSYLNGTMHDRVYRKDGGLTDAQRAATQRHVANKGGVTL